MAHFDPTKVVTNPADLYGPVRAFLRFFKQRRELRTCFRIMLLAGPVLMAACSVLLVALIPIYIEFFIFQFLNKQFKLILICFVVVVTVIAAIGFLFICVSSTQIGQY